MRIDFVVDSFSGIQRIRHPQPAGNRPVDHSREQSTRPEPSRPERRDPNHKITQHKQTAPSQDQIDASREAAEILNADEKRMLQQLFPPGLFGAGIRAYRNISLPPTEHSHLGKQIDVTQ
jgi:hypothetical protein